MRLLETSSYEVQTFGTACELIAALPRWLPDCLIVDLDAVRVVDQARKQSDFTQFMYGEPEVPALL